MKAKNVTAAAMVVVLGAAVAGTAVVGVEVHERYTELGHAPAYSLSSPEPVVAPAGRGQAGVDDVDQQALSAALGAAAADPVLGTLHGRVTDTTTGGVVWNSNADQALQPASATKLLTAAAAILAMAPDKTLTTEVVAGSTPGTLVIRASGDVWLDREAIEDLAGQIAETGQSYHEVIIDTSVWTGPTILPGWDPADVDGGYTAPMEPAMIHGARIGATEGDVPRSHTPALDVARALADRIGAAEVSTGPAPADAAAIASVESPPLSERLEYMVKWSDNVMAEAIGRELAIARGAEPSVHGATRTTLAVLAEHGFDTTGVTLADNSGLSELNLIPPRLLDDLLVAAAAGTDLRPLLGALPVARGVGTLEDRYADLSGRGWVRAKTGTLTGTNALAGTVTGESGHIYTFALLSNAGGDTLSVRRALDEFASVLRTF